MSYLSTASPAGCSQERLMDVGDWEGEAKVVGDRGTGGAVGVFANKKPLVHKHVYKTSQS